MHLKCIQHGLVAKQDVISQFLKIMDPEEVAQRSRRRVRRRQYSSRGPNYLWHIDCYDKLKPYGITINGCIDGYSRHINWLKTAYSNNDPRIISGYFINCVEMCCGCPRSIGTDFGTENRHVEHI